MFFKKSLENSIFKGSVDSKTLDTNNGLRNWSLRSGKYFDVDDHPKITFESKEISKKGDAKSVANAVISTYLSHYIPQDRFYDLTCLFCHFQTKK